MANGGDQPDRVRALHVVMLRAFIYLREMANGLACIDYCAAMGYRVLGVVYDPDGTKYDDLFDAMLRGDADLIVTYAVADLPADRVPRVEAITAMRRESPPPDPDRPTKPLRRRRPRPTR